jgi:hypothetical protein
MARYRQPRKLNFVSLLVYVALAALAYSAIQFGPPLYRNMKVDEIVRAAVNEYWATTRGAPSREAPQELQDSVEKRIRDIGVDDPELSLAFDHDSTDLTVAARYHVVIQHPLVKRSTVLTFHPSASTAIVDKRQ